MQQIYRTSPCSSEETRPARWRRSSAVVVLVLALLAAKAAAQLSAGGTPPSFTQPLRADIPRLVMSPVDVPALLAEDAIEESKGVPYRFGFPFDGEYSLENSGVWENLADGGRVWRLTFASPGAYSINLIFSRYRLPEGAQLFVYNADRTDLIGAFTSRNNKPHGEMATAPVKGDEITVEYYEPAAVVYEGEITISRVVHAYKDIFKTAKDALDFGGSGSCNNNVNCPEGAAWQKEKRAVAMVLLSGGTRWCSGSMINNVRQDKTPYFLTANHCLGSSNTWIIMFNYESPTCANINGPTWMTVQGSTLKANYSTSDVGLLLLNEAPPDSFKVTFNGWNNVNVNGDSAVGIHHPAGDIKKISFDYDSYESTDYLGSTVNSSLSHWRIAVWDDGTTEGGSSGSPLYNKQHQVVGQLHGGWAACNDLRADYYGKFSLSWTGGGTPATRLRDWLDPDNTGATFMNTWDPYAGVQIAHTPLEDTKDTVNNYQVLANITADAAFHPDSLLLHYSIDFTPYLDTMVATGNPNEFQGFIPAQTPGTFISYYLEAHAVNGKADTTETFNFRVIDYAVQVSPSISLGSGAVDDTVWHSLTVTNDGLFNDTYNLSLFGADWATTLWDETQSSQITATPNLTPNATFDFKARVIIPASFFGQIDTATVTATSQADPLVSQSSSLRTTSAGQPVELPFVDNFVTTTVDPSLWVQWTNVTIDGVGIAEPSEPNSVRLNGNPTGADTLMSQAINLNVASGVNIGYYFEKKGGGDSPESGDDLIVEYYTDAGTWAELTRHLGSSVDMTAYAYFSTGVPNDGYHSAFRIRFRTVATAGALDDWFVDNINIDFGPAIAVNPGSFVENLHEDDSTYDELVIDNSGLGGLSYSVVVQPLLTKSEARFAELAAQDRVQTAHGESELPAIELPKDQRDKAPRGPDVIYDAGGPDTFGYIWIDSDDPGGPTYNWIDISATGTDIIGALNDDNFSGPYPIGFAFPYYDGNYTQFYLASNGYIGFGPTDNYASRFNAAIPAAATPNNAIYWCWTDLNPDDADNPGGKVLYQNVGGDLVISWINYPEYESGVNPGDVITAQMILSPDGGIKLQYQSMGAGFDLTSNTIGTENLGGTDGLQVSLNTSYIHPNLAIEFAKPKQWLYVEPLTGTVAPGAADTLTLKFVSTDLDTGTYQANVKITSNDPLPQNNPLILPATLNVLPPGPFYMCGDCNEDEIVNISDAVYLISYIFSGGPAPNPLEAGDSNCDALVNISDAVYLIGYIFSGGSVPCAACP